MDRQSYKSYHEAFVSNHKGTTMLEINMISLICPLSVLFLNKIEIWISKSANLSRLFIEFIILAVPLLLALTKFITPFDTVFAFTVLTAFANVIPSETDPKNVETLTSKKLSFLTNYRASMLLVTSICILAVDFVIYPRRFAKTEEVGFGLMDIGVGSFVFSAGTVSPTSTKKTWRNIIKSLPLFILGIGKYAMTKTIDYHSHVSEYGVHWNFFITLGLISLFGGTLTSICNRKLTFILAVAFGIGYELLLNKYSLYSWVFNLSESRRLKSGLVIANIEGVLSLPGYLSLYLVGNSVKDLINKVNSSNWKRMALSVITLWSLFIVLINEDYLTLPSRRLCNLTYVIWMAAYNLSLISLFSGVEILTGNY